MHQLEALLPLFLHLELELGQRLGVPDLVAGPIVRLCPDRCVRFSVSWFEHVFICCICIAWAPYHDHLFTRPHALFLHDLDVYSVLDYHSDQYIGLGLDLGLVSKLDLAVFHWPLDLGFHDQ